MSALARTTSGGGVGVGEDARAGAGGTEGGSAAVEAEEGVSSMGERRVGSRVAAARGARVDDTDEKDEAEADALGRAESRESTTVGDYGLRG